jgi:hypothetical protein
LPEPPFGIGSRTAAVAEAIHVSSRLAKQVQIDDLSGGRERRLRQNPTPSVQGQGLTTTYREVMVQWQTLWIVHAE